MQLRIYAARRTMATRARTTQTQGPKACQAPIGNTRAPYLKRPAAHTHLRTAMDRLPEARRGGRRSYPRWFSKVGKPTASQRRPRITRGSTVQHLTDMTYHPAVRRMRMQDPQPSLSQSDATQLLTYGCKSLPVPCGELPACTSRRPTQRSNMYATHLLARRPFAKRPM